MGENNGANQSGSSESGSSYDSSSSDDHKRNKLKKKGNKTKTGIDTPIGEIELEPDEFRGAIFPGILFSNANRGNNSSQHLEEHHVENDRITPGNRYNPDESSSRDATENLIRKKTQKKHKTSHRSRRNSRKGSKRTFWHRTNKEF
jgi:hypothetical protein